MYDTVDGSEIQLTSWCRYLDSLSILSSYLQGFVHPSWLFGISEPSTVYIELWPLACNRSWEVWRFIYFRLIWMLMVEIWRPKTSWVRVGTVVYPANLKGFFYIPGGFLVGFLRHQTSFQHFMPEASSLGPEQGWTSWRFFIGGSSLQKPCVGYTYLPTVNQGFGQLPPKASSTKMSLKMDAIFIESLS